MSPVPLELAGVTDPRGRAAFELEAVGLGHRLSHYPAQLSGGEQQRVAIARATAPRPQLLLADEPTGNLDSATGTAIIDLLFERAGHAGAGLLVITHDAAVAARAARTCTWPTDGWPREPACAWLRDFRGGLKGLGLLWLCLAVAIAGLLGHQPCLSVDSAIAANGRDCSAAT